MRYLFLLTPLALAACGPDSQFGHLTCRNAMYADPAVKAAIAGAASPDSDAGVLRAKQAAFDACLVKYDTGRNAMDRDPIFRAR